MNDTCRLAGSCTIPLWVIVEKAAADYWTERKVGSLDPAAVESSVRVSHQGPLHPRPRSAMAPGQYTTMALWGRPQPQLSESSGSAAVGKTEDAAGKRRNLRERAAKVTAHPAGQKALAAAAAWLALRTTIEVRCGPAAQWLPARAVSSKVT